MKIEHTQTGETVAEDVDASVAEELIAAGADGSDVVEQADSQTVSPDASQSDGSDGPAEGIADVEDIEYGDDLEVSKVDTHGDDTLTPDDARDVDEDRERDTSSLEYDPDEEMDVDTTSIDGFEDQYERVKRAEETQDSDLEQDKRHRQERIESGKVQPGDNGYAEVGNETVRQYLRDTGQAEDIRDAFSDFSSAERWIAGDDGDRLNDDAVIDLVAGDSSAVDRMYERKERAEPGDRVIGVCTDMSGSMKGTIRECKAAIGGCALAADELGDDFVATAWTSTEKRGKENQVLTLITGPDEEFDWRQLDAVWPNYQDPITPGMRQCKGYMDDVSAAERVLIVVTDGQPQQTADGTYNASEAVAEAREEVEHYRNEGYVVIGLGIEPGVDEATMGEMFGEDGFVLSDEDSISESLKSIYEDQMRVQGGL